MFALAPNTPYSICVMYPYTITNTKNDIENVDTHVTGDGPFNNNQIA